MLFAASTKVSLRAILDLVSVPRDRDEAFLNEMQRLLYIRIAIWEIPRAFARRLGTGRSDI